MEAADGCARRRFARHGGLEKALATLSKDPVAHEPPLEALAEIAAAIAAEACAPRPRQDARLARHFETNSSKCAKLRSTLARAGANSRTPESETMETPFQRAAQTARVVFFPSWSKRLGRDERARLLGFFCSLVSRGHRSHDDDDDDESTQAYAEGLDFQGGKHDDVTVVVAIVLDAPASLSAFDEAPRDNFGVFALAPDDDVSET